jgi:hypothetical protein
MHLSESNYIGLPPHKPRTTRIMSRRTRRICHTSHLRSLPPMQREAPIRALGALPEAPFNQVDPYRDINTQLD